MFRLIIYIYQLIFRYFVLLSIATIILLILLSLFLPKSFGDNIKIEDINHIYVFDGNNGKDTIRKDPFFYKCNDELCFEYIKKLESELVK